MSPWFFCIRYSFLTKFLRASVLSSTKNDRSTNKSNHGGHKGPVVPHKVDFLLIASTERSKKVVHIGVVNLEHKSPTASQGSVDIQLRKTMRHNHSNLHQVPMIQEKIFLDIHGMYVGDCGVGT